MNRMQKYLSEPITTVLFDMDDTLLESFPVRVETLKHVFEHAGLTNLNAKNLLQQYRGVEIGKFLSLCGVASDRLDELFLLYRRIYWTGEYSVVNVFPGIRPLLEKLHADGIKLGVVTQKSRDFDFEGHRAGAIIELEKANVLHLFSVIIGFDDIKQTKPDPEGIHKALGILKSRAGETLFIGDSIADMKAAQAANCRSCYARWGVPFAENLPADFIAETPLDLLSIINGTSGNK